MIRSQMKSCIMGGSRDDRIWVGVSSFRTPAHRPERRKSIEMKIRRFVLLRTLITIDQICRVRKSIKSNARKRIQIRMLEELKKNALKFYADFSRHAIQVKLPYSERSPFTTEVLQHESRRVLRRLFAHFVRFMDQRFIDRAQPHFAFNVLAKLYFS